MNYLYSVATKEYTGIAMDDEPINEGFRITNIKPPETAFNASAFFDEDKGAWYIMDTSEEDARKEQEQFDSMIEDMKRRRGSLLMEARELADILGEDEEASELRSRAKLINEEIKAAEKERAAVLAAQVK